MACSIGPRALKCQCACGQGILDAITSFHTTSCRSTLRTWRPWPLCSSARSVLMLPLPCASRSTCEQGRRCMDCPLACLLAVAAFRELSLWIDPLLLHGTGSASAACCVPRPCHVHRSLRSLGLLPEEAGHMRSCTVLIRQWERDTWGFVPRAFAPLLEANGRRMRDIEYLSFTVCLLL